MSRGSRILVVEDNPITRKMIRVALETDGFEVQEAGDGRTAVQLVRDGRPDLVLQDLMLPDTSGVQLVGQLRALPGAADLPILALTGFLPREEEARALTAGFTEYLIKPIAFLQKPFTPEFLARKVREVLDRPG